MATMNVSVKPRSRLPFLDQLVEICGPRIAAFNTKSNGARRVMRYHDGGDIRSFTFMPQVAHGLAVPCADVRRHQTPVRRAIDSDIAIVVEILGDGVFHVRPRCCADKTNPADFDRIHLTTPNDAYNLGEQRGDQCLHFFEEKR